MFESIVNLKYIAFKNTISTENMKEFIIERLKNPNFIPCHNNEDLQQDEFPSICCYYDLELGRCQQTNNYIVLNYSKEYLKYYYNKNNLHFGYPEGFAKDNIQRKSISFINYNNLTYRFDRKSNFSFDYDKVWKGEDQIIELHFFEPIKSLSSFFSGDYDNIASIDFSHFDSSIVIL